MENTELIPLAPADLASRGEYRKYTKNSKQVYLIQVKDIEFRPNFNHRIFLGDMELLESQIIASGGLEEAITVDALANGKFYLEDGERRILAYRSIISKGIDGFDEIDAFINVKAKTDLQRYASMLAKNNGGKAFEPLEQGNVYAAMMKQENPETGKLMTQTDIAKLTGHSKMHISNMLRAANLDDTVIGAIKDGKVSTTAAVDMDKAGLTPEEQINAINEAEQSGEKLKVTDVKKKKDKSLVLPKWEPTMGEEIKVLNVKQLEKYLGRIFAWPVVAGWEEDFIDEDTGEVVTIDRNQIIIGQGAEMDDDHIALLIDSNIKLIRLRYPLTDNKPLDKPLGHDEVFDDENNAEMDHQEKQENGIEGGVIQKRKSLKLTDKLIEVSVMAKGLEAWLNDRNPFPDDLYPFEQLQKIIDAVADCKKIHENS